MKEFGIKFIGEELIHVVENFIDKSNRQHIQHVLELMVDRGLMEKRGDYKYRKMRSHYSIIDNYLYDYAIKANNYIENMYDLSYQPHILDYGTFASEAGYAMEPHIDTVNDYEAFNYLKYSSVIYLNDDFEGGEIVFPIIGIEYKPKAGDAIFFPSDDIKYLHGVNSIKSGNRYTLAYWHGEDGDWEKYFTNQSKNS
jgi:prolyl 4-hydroxylase